MPIAADMKNFIRMFLFAAAILATCALARAEFFQEICVNIVDYDNVRVDGEVVPTEMLTETILKDVRGNDRVRVVLMVPNAFSQAELRKIMDYCRKAGVTHFLVTTKI